MLINYVLNNMIVPISVMLFSSSLTLFCLDGFRLSNIRLIKYIQLFTFVFIPLYLLFYIYNVFNIFLINKVLFENICCMADNKDINLHGHVSVNAEAGKAIGRGLQTIGTQIGLGATMVGVATAVGKAMAKSGMPPLQKAGVIIGSSVLSGLAHSRISIMNRNMINETDLNTSTSIDSNFNISKFLSETISSPLQDLLVNFEMTNYVCLSLIYIIIIQLLFKMYFKDEINLKNFNLLNAN
jgi:hypothetical protein